MQVELTQCVFELSLTFQYMNMCTCEHKTTVKHTANQDIGMFTSLLFSSRQDRSGMTLNHVQRLACGRRHSISPAADPTRSSGWTLQNHAPRHCADCAGVAHMVLPNDRSRRWWWVRRRRCCSGPTCRLRCYRRSCRSAWTATAHWRQSTCCAGGRRPLPAWRPAPLPLRCALPFFFQVPCSINLVQAGSGPWPLCQ